MEGVSISINSINKFEDIYNQEKYKIIEIIKNNILKKEYNKK